MRWHFDGTFEFLKYRDQEDFSKTSLRYDPDIIFQKITLRNVDHKEIILIQGHDLSLKHGNYLCETEMTPILFCANRPSLVFDTKPSVSGTLQHTSLLFVFRYYYFVIFLVVLVNSRK